MRRAAKIDANQPEIVGALREVGASVAITSAVGDGFPDLVVGFRGFNFLMEIKDGTKPPSARKLTDDQIEFHADWLGSLCVVKTINEALIAIGVKVAP